MTTPITNAVPLLRAALASALSAYWLQAPINTPRPYRVFQAQDGGGADTSFLNSAGWAGLYTIRAHADTQGEADAALANVPAAMQALSVAGYTVTATFVRALVLPPLDGVWSAGLIYSIDLFRRG